MAPVVSAPNPAEVDPAAGPTAGPAPDPTYNPALGQPDPALGGAAALNAADAEAESQRIKNAAAVDRAFREARDAINRGDWAAVMQALNNVAGVLDGAPPVRVDPAKPQTPADISDHANSIALKAFGKQQLITAYQALDTAELTIKGDGSAPTYTAVELSRMSPEQLNAALAHKILGLTETLMRAGEFDRAGTTFDMLKYLGAAAPIVSLPAAGDQLPGLLTPGAIRELEKLKRAREGGLAEAGVAYTTAQDAQGEIERLLPAMEAQVKKAEEELQLRLGELGIDINALTRDAKGVLDLSAELTRRTKAVEDLVKGIKTKEEEIQYLEELLEKKNKEADGATGERKAELEEQARKLDESVRAAEAELEKMRETLAAAHVEVQRVNAVTELAQQEATAQKTLADGRARLLELTRQLPALFEAYQRANQISGEAASVFEIKEDAAIRALAEAREKLEAAQNPAAQAVNQ